jgi:hypothetical protein
MEYRRSLVAQQDIRALRRKGAKGRKRECEDYFSELCELGVLREMSESN